MSRYMFGLVSYWLLFLIVPEAVILILLRSSHFVIIIGIIAFLALLMIGEHGIRLWDWLWKTIEKRLKGPS